MSGAMRGALAVALACAPMSARAEPAGAVEGERAVVTPAVSLSPAASASAPAAASSVEPAEPAEPIVPPRARAEMTDEQRALHQNGEVAARAGDWETAARYFRASVSLGGFNLGWLGLGEALAQLGRCAEAATALDAVATAPEVPEAPARFADAMALAHRQALGRTCPGRLVVECAAPLARFRVGKSPHPCGEAIELAPGRYRLTAGSDEMPIVVDAWVVGVETTRMTLNLPTVVSRPAPALPPPVEPGPGPWGVAGYTTLGVGALVAIGAVGLNLATLDAEVDARDAAADWVAGTRGRGDVEAAYAEHASLRDWTVGLYIGAGALAAMGLVMVLADPGEAGGRPVGSSLELGPRGLGGRF